MDDKNGQAVLNRAIRFVRWLPAFESSAHLQLEQYFDLIVFAAYLEEEEAGDSGVTFSQWLKVGRRGG
jgi:hypothetical protein